MPEDETPLLNNIIVSMTKKPANLSGDIYENAILADAIITQHDMEVVDVDSSWIQDVQYNSLTKAMTIDLIDDGQNYTRYTYFSVSQATYNAFVNAPSKGRFINNVIKNGFFPFIRQ